MVAVAEGVVQPLFVKMLLPMVTNLNVEFVRVYRKIYVTSYN